MCRKITLRLSLSSSFNLQKCTWSQWAWLVAFKSWFCVIRYKFNHSQLLKCKTPSVVTTNPNPQRGMPAIHGIQVNLWHKNYLMRSAASVCFLTSGGRQYALVCGIYDLSMKAIRWNKSQMVGRGRSGSHREEKSHKSSEGSTQALIKN